METSATNADTYVSTAILIEGTFLGWPGFSFDSGIVLCPAL